MDRLRRDRMLPAGLGLVVTALITVGLLGCAHKLARPLAAIVSNFPSWLSRPHLPCRTALLLIILLLPTRRGSIEVTKSRLSSICSAGEAFERDRGQKDMLQATKRRRSSGTTTAGRDSEATFVLLPESFESPNGPYNMHDKLRRRTVLDGVAAARVVLLDSAEGGSLRSVDTGSTSRHKGDEDIVSYGKDDPGASAAQERTAIFYPSLDPAFIIAAEPVSLDKLAIKPDSVEVSAKRARTAKDDLLEQAVVLVSPPFGFCGVGKPRLTIFPLSRQLNAHTAEMRVSGNANSRRTGPGRNATALLLRAATAVLAFELPCVGSLSDCTCVGTRLSHGTPEIPI